MKNYCYLNGKIMPLAKAGIHPTDIGFLRGYGIFEVLRTYKGNPFLFEEHFKRLKQSAEHLNIKLPIKEKQIRQIVGKLIKLNGFKKSTIRIILTGGKRKDTNAMDGISSLLCILIDKLHLLPVEVYKRGVKLITTNYKRDMPEAKVLNYIVPISLHKKMEKEKAFEILYISNGLVLEASTSNFFIFKGNTLITPANGVLKGITRSFVIDLAKRQFKIEEKNLPVKELKSASEAFITASNKEIVPVVKIDNLKIGNGRVGRNTQSLMEMFAEYVGKY